MITCQICEHNPTGERCELFGRVIGMHGCSSGIERKPRNHFEEIKAMSMEEMAWELCRICRMPFYKDDSEIDTYEVDCWAKWLKEEITDAETE